MKTVEAIKATHPVAAKSLEWNKTPTVHRGSERLYESYVRYCESIGVAPATRETWWDVNERGPLR